MQLYFGVNSDPCLYGSKNDSKINEYATESKQWPQTQTCSATLVTAVCAIALPGAVPFVVHDNKVSGKARGPKLNPTQLRELAVCVHVYNLCSVYSQQRPY